MRLANNDIVSNIIRQGRCTLVATIQMYKILALNCLITAYSLSVQYLDGIKFGDYQVTITGMLMSVCFLCISRAKVRLKKKQNKKRRKDRELKTKLISLLRNCPRRGLWVTFSTFTCCFPSCFSLPSTLWLWCTSLVFPNLSRSELSIA